MDGEKRVRVLVSSCGGPAAENVVRNLRLGGHTVLGVDRDGWMVQLSSVDKGFLVPDALGHSEEYVGMVHDLVGDNKVDVFIPVSDGEIVVSAWNRDRFGCPVHVPDVRVVRTCRDKLLLYMFMRDRGLETPRYYGLDSEFHGKRWFRARIGAGGHLAHPVLNRGEVEVLLTLYKSRADRFMLTEYLPGRNYCWTSLYRDGGLTLSVTKERLKWVYDRIGTTAVQRTVHNERVNETCEAVVDQLMMKYDRDMTGLMMVDLKENREGDPLVTEINAGRTGTVSRWMALASRYFHGDNRANFHTRLLSGRGWDMVRDVLPPGVVCIRHIDMGYLLTYKGEPVVRETSYPRFRDNYTETCLNRYVSKVVPS